MSRLPLARRLAAACAAAALAPVAARAQSIPMPRLTLGAGPIFGASDTPSLLTNAFWQVGAEWAQRGTRPGVRLTAVGWRRERTIPALGFLFPTGMECVGGVCTDYQREVYSGLVLDGKYEFLHGAVRPYVASGIGAYRVRERLRLDYTCTSDGTSPAVRCTPSDTPRSAGSAWQQLGLHAAGGVAVSLGRSQLFGEVRLQSNVPQSGTFGHAYPVVFGVRF